MTSGAAVGAALLVPGLLAAQTAAAPGDTAPRVDALIAASVGARPNFAQPSVGAVAIVGMTGGLRYRRRRHVAVEALASRHGDVLTADYVTASPARAGRTVRSFDDRVRRASSIGSLQARVAAEGTTSPKSPRFRATAGGGYMTTIAIPFASLGAGVSARGRSVRALLDAEAWLFRLPVTETTYGTTGTGRTPDVVATRTFHAREHATIVRLGLDVPLTRTAR